MSSIILIAGKYAATMFALAALPSLACSKNFLVSARFLSPTRYLYNARSAGVLLISGVETVGSGSITLAFSKF